MNPFSKIFLQELHTDRMQPSVPQFVSIAKRILGDVWKNNRTSASRTCCFSEQLFTGTKAT